MEQSRSRDSAQKSPLLQQKLLDDRKRKSGDA